MFIAASSFAENAISKLLDFTLEYRFGTSLA
jgi:hypothetical protein